MVQFRRIALQAVTLGLLFIAAPAALALSPDEIALVVNAKVPESRKLAELYAQQRHIPDGRIIELQIDPISIPSPAEEMSFASYEPLVAQPIRDFLETNRLRNKVTCLVTFWGVPLRIGRRVLTQEDKDDLARIRKELEEARGVVAQHTALMEQSAAQLAPGYQPPEIKPGALPEVQRLDAALTAIFRALPNVPDRSARTARFLQAVSTAERMFGSARTKEMMSQSWIAPFAPRPPTREEVASAREELAQAERQMAALQPYVPTAKSREELRQIAKKVLGMVGYAGVLASQEQSFQTESTESAVDSELSVLWWRGYPKARWVDNVLHWRVQQVLRQKNLSPPQSLMVTRLDGPSEQIVRDLILTSVKVEAEGLNGQVALDARGKTGTDAYGRYDQSIRELASLLKTKTRLQVTFENTEALIPAHSLKDIAVYCGWYSLRSYSPPGTFSPGAVGFHIASLELVSLRAVNEGGWVRGLMVDGVAATLGPVAEPYLQSFPPADEFFPLLMTGRLTLAEIYWRTEPWASWMQTCIGDPLYTPYKKNPPLSISDMPTPLRAALEPPVPPAPATPPATAPATAPSTQP